MTMGSRLNTHLNKSLTRVKAFTITGQSHRDFVYISVLIFSIVIFLPLKSQNDLWEARANYLSDSPTDFWGGWSSVVFGNFPNILVGWQSNVIALQIAATVLGIYRLFRGSSGVVQYAVLYVAIIFSTYNTRDSFIFSLLVLSFSILNKNNSKVFSKRRITFQITIFIMVISIAMAMRPWNILSIITLLLAVNFLNPKEKRVIIGKSSTIITVLLISILPLTLELTSTKLSKLESAASIQQVIVMDMASNFCWGSNPKSNEIAAEGLKLFSSSPEFLRNVCSFYKPNVWVSLINPSALSAFERQSGFALIKPGEKELQNKLLQLWKQMILVDPPTYLTNKSMQFSQVVVAGEGRTITLFETKDNKSIKTSLKGLALLPFELLILFHIPSIAFSSLILLIVLVFRIGEKSHWKLAGYLLVANLIWATTTTIAFLGDNGRYTYPITILSFVLLLANRKSKS
jgi:hypothetical protein